MLAGFNIANSTVTLKYLMNGIIDYNIDKFEVRFKQMHSQAIVLIPEGGQEITTEAVTEPHVSESETEEQASETISWETSAVSETVSETEITSESTVSETAQSEVDSDFFTGTSVS